MAVTRVVDWLRAASKKMGQEYMKLPVANSDPQYRERVYCYELYHHLRNEWTRSFPFSLCGEIDKRNHAYVHGKHLTNIKPDLLIHQLGWMDSFSNLLAIEVKAANAKYEDIRIDLRKLTALRQGLRGYRGKRANYNYAFFWIYDLCVDAWPDLRSKVFRKRQRDIDRRLIRCFIHERPGKSAIEVFWE